MVLHDVRELVDVVEAHDDHEGLVELRICTARGVSRRLVEIEVECEQRREQVVLKRLGAVADFARHEIFVQKIEIGLMRVEC